MPSLDRRTVALLESRFSSELATLVRRLGGTPVSAPAVIEVPRHDDFGTFISGLAGRRFSLAIFLTGTGITTLFREAEHRGRLAEALSALKDLTIVCRGTKPLAVLNRYGLRARITTARPHTTQELLGALGVVELQGRGVLLVHYGERNVSISQALRERGARLEEVCPYEWALPEDTAPLEAVVRDAIARRLDAMLFTSQVQCRHLFDVAADMGVSAALSSSLNRQIVVGAVGPVCAERLRLLGVTPDVIPASPNMPALITAVGDYFELTDRLGAGG